MPEAHCPHCMMVIAPDAADGGFPPAPMRCPYCRLAIAPGRGQFDLHGDRTAGSASGVLAHAARREVSAPVTDEEITQALQVAARAANTPVQRLRMIDYERVSGRDSSLPRLSSILERCGTWKAARRMVDEGRASPKASGGDRR